MSKLQRVDFRGAGLEAGFFFLSGAMGMADSADDLADTFGNFARQIQNGETAWTDLDAATFAAQLSGGGADYFFTMGTLTLLMTIGDYAAGEDRCE